MSEEKSNDKKHSYGSQYVIHPDNGFKLIFDILGFLLITYQTITVPLTISFNFESDSLKGFDYFSDVYFLIDILLNFNTGFYLEGMLIMDRCQICKYYLKGWFAIDIVSSFPYSFIFDNIESNLEITVAAAKAPKLLRIIKIIRFVKILRLLKLVKFKSIIYKIEDLLYSDRIYGIFVYFKTMIIFFFLWHFLACVLFSITMNESLSNDETLGGSFLADQSISYQYQFMLYFIFTSFFTIGYGDIHPRTINEKIFSMFMMLLSYSLFCFMVSTIRNLVQKTIESEQDLKNKLRNVKTFFKEKNLSQDLTSKVTKYLEFIYTEKENRRMEDNDIFALLNDKLGNDLRIEINKRVLLKLKLFRKSKFDQLVNKFCEKVYEEVINPNEIIITEGDLISRRMYFIDKGHILLYHDATTVILKELGPNNYFGEVGFFTQEPNKEMRTASAITKTFCNINFILQPEFLNLIENCNQPELKTEMLNLFQNRNRETLLKKLSIKCFYCHERHFIKDCEKFNKCSNLIFISKDKQDNYSERIRVLKSLNEFKAVNINHFNRLKKTLTRKKTNNNRRSAIMGS